MQTPGVKENLKIAIVSLLMLGCLALTYSFHVVLGSGALFTHFFYIPVVLSAFWWKRKKLLVLLVLAGYMIFSRYCCWPQEMASHEDFLRAVVLMVTASIVAMLAERITRAERKQKESEARYRMVFECMSDGVAVCGPLGQGEDFVLIDSNQAAERIDGINRQDHRGKNVLEVLPRIRGSVCWRFCGGYGSPGRQRPDWALLSRTAA